MDDTNVFNISKLITEASDGIRLNIGCGNAPMKGFINVDPYDSCSDASWDAGAIPLKDGSVALIVTTMTVEHFQEWRVIPIFKEWYRVLKKGGKLFIQTTNLVEVCRKTIETAQTELDLGYLYGAQTREGQYHYTGFTGKSICRLLGAAGFPLVRVGDMPADWIGEGYKDLFALGEK